MSYSSDEVAARFSLIYQTMLIESPRVETPQFESIEEGDLHRLFQLYDEHFFGGLLAAMIKRSGGPPIEFRLSSRMTRAAGKTVFQKVRRRFGGWRVEQARYEIAVSSFLLFQAFRDDVIPGGGARPVIVAGVVCLNRLEALMRIFEHELLHLAEFLASGRSSCSATPFREMSRAIFGHEASVHAMMTPVEFAAAVHSIVVGDRVAFEHGGIERQGFVRRITKRATVIVADPSGRVYSDGNRYHGYLVPLDRLRKL